MSMENVKFEGRPNAHGGDPGKLAYLHNPDWKGKPFVEGTRVDDRCCPGCLFPDAKPGKWPHVSDSRCTEWRAANAKYISPRDTFLGKSTCSCDGSGQWKHGLGAGGFCVCPAGQKLTAERVALLEAK